MTNFALLRASVLLCVCACVRLFASLRSRPPWLCVCARVRAQAAFATTTARSVARVRVSAAPRAWRLWNHRRTAACGRRAAASRALASLRAVRSLARSHARLARALNANFEFAGETRVESRGAPAAGRARDGRDGRLRDARQHRRTWRCSDGWRGAGARWAARRACRALVLAFLAGRLPLTARRRRRRRRRAAQAKQRNMASSALTRVKPNFYIHGAWRVRRPRRANACCPTRGSHSLTLFADAQFSTTIKT